MVHILVRYIYKDFTPLHGTLRPIKQYRQTSHNYTGCNLLHDKQKDAIFVNVYKPSASELTQIAL